MPSYQATIRARHGDRIPGWDPNVYTLPVPTTTNDHWLTRDGALVVEIASNEPRVFTAAEWTEVGDWLLPLLTTGRVQIGFGIDGRVNNQFSGGVIPEEFALAVIQRLTASTGKGIASLTWVRAPWKGYPRGYQGPRDILPGISLQEVRDAEDMAWISDLWHWIDGDILHVEVEAMVTCYDSVVATGFPSLRERGERWLDEMLDVARSWLVPLGENEGFLLGLFEDSEEYAAVMAGASPRTYDESRSATDG